MDPEERETGEVVRSGEEGEVGVDEYPPSHPGATWRAYYAAMEVLADRMNRIFAVCLELPEDWFGDKFDSASTARH
jgi:isopenicillin N synthase-like dioxygenase